MRRRELIAGLEAVAAWPMAVRAQQGDRVPRIGVLMGGAGSDPVYQSFVAAMREVLAKLGWIEGRNLQIEFRFGETDANRMRAQAAGLVSLAPNVIATTGAPAARAMQQQTQTIPIVVIGVGDPVANGCRQTASQGMETDLSSRPAARCRRRGPECQRNERWHGAANPAYLPEYGASCL